EAQRMGVLIDDLLAFSRLGRQSLAPASLDIRQLFDEVLREVKGMRPERVIEFSANGAPPTVADRTTLRQAVVNLLSNAVKYAKRRSRLGRGETGRRGDLLLHPAED